HSDDRFRASKEALKYIYYVVAGIAITDALSRAFAPDGQFLGRQLLTSNRRPTLLLLVALLTTIFRFVHGASIHLDSIHKGSIKTLFDFFGFFGQASLFYLMALSLANAAMFCVLLFVMLGLDALWLLVFRPLSSLGFRDTEVQWIVSDVVF